MDEDLVILHAITANWGTNGPARDRFYAFDKITGELVWTSTPGTTPQDTPLQPLVFEDLEDGRRVFTVEQVVGMLFVWMPVLASHCGVLKCLTVE